MVKLRKLLYLIPVRLLLYDKSDIIFTKSFRIVPEGKDLIHDFPHIRNNLKLAIPRQNVEYEMLYMANKD